MKLTKQTDSIRCQTKITLSACCGCARHEVVYAVTPWGHTFQTYTPCQSLPRGLLNALGCNCAILAPEIRTALQWTAHPESELSASWLQENIDPRGELRSYLDYLACNQTRIAIDMLGSTKEVRLLSALKLGTTSEKWAAAVIASQTEAISNRVLSLLRSNCFSTQPVTRALALVCVVRNPTKESRICVEECLLDETVALPLRDHLALSLAQAHSNTPPKMLSCEVTESSGCKRTESWEQLRTRGCNFAGERVTKIVHRITVPRSIIAIP